MNLLPFALTAVISFGITAILGFTMIPWLRRLKFGQTILDIGPKWHKSKQGTPTMGGFMFIFGIILSVVIAMLATAVAGSKLYTGESPLYKTRLWGGILLALGFGLIGFVDDYIKVVKKRNLGLNVKQKTLLQLLVSGGYMTSLYLAGDTSMIIPFLGSVNMGIWYIPFGIIVIYFAINAVNFTDGIDGLCSSVTIVSGIAFFLIAQMFTMSGLSTLSAALVGGCAGFLLWNFNPAKVFMGDTGSMFLGGLVAALGFGVNCPLILVPIGIVYVCEAGSVVIQILYFKATGGKRLFKMSPIHHHYELSGWSEKKIVLSFSIVALIGGTVGYILMRLG